MADSALVRTSSANSSISPPTSRRKAVGVLLTKIAVCTRQPLPEAAVLDFQASIFDEALTEAGVPTEDLDAVYRRAIGGHTSSFPLGTGELITAWQTLAKEREYAARVERDLRRQRDARRDAAQAAAEHATHTARMADDTAYRAEYEAYQAARVEWFAAMQRREKPLPPLPVRPPIFVEDDVPC